MTHDDVAVARVETLCWGDFHLDQARKAAETIGVYVDCKKDAPKRYFDFFTASMLEAAWHYRAAGLGLLAGRVAYFARRTDGRVSFDKLDRLNAGGCGVA